MRLSEVFGDCSLIIESDASQFDSNTCKPLLRQAWLIFKSCFELNREVVNLLNFLEDNFIEKFLVHTSGALVYFDRGIPSGSNFTTIIGSIYNALVWYHVFKYKLASVNLMS